MKKTPALTAMLLLVAATATACGTNDTNTKQWFAENCALQTGDIRAEIVQGEPGGANVGKAIIQGPIRPPSNASTKIGLYTYDEAAGQMKQEGQADTNSTFCLEPNTKNAENRKTIPSTNVEGDLQKNLREADFTKLRSPEYPEGIWAGLHVSDLPDGFQIEGNDERCAGTWWPASDIIPVEEAVASAAKIAQYAVTSPDDC